MRKNKIAGTALRPRAFGRVGWAFGVRVNGEPVREREGSRSQVKGGRGIRRNKRRQAGKQTGRVDQAMRTEGSQGRPFTKGAQLLAAAATIRTICSHPPLLRRQIEHWSARRLPAVRRHL